LSTSKHTLKACIPPHGKRPEISQDFLEESLYFLGTVQQPFLSFYSATMPVGQLAKIRPVGPVNIWFHLGNQFYKE
jgi:hypothetical protein